MRKAGIAAVGPNSDRVDLTRKVLVSAFSAAFLGELCGYRKGWTAENAEGFAESADKIIDSRRDIVDFYAFRAAKAAHHTRPQVFSTR